MKISDIFKALGDEKRINILRIVAKGEICACELNELFNLSQPTISHHLKVLSTAGLINVDKRGKWCYYSVNSRKISEIQQSLGDIIEVKSVDNKNIKNMQCND